MKYKDFLTKLKDNGKISHAKFLEAIDKAPDAEFPDEAFEAFEGSFLTVDRAAAHPEVNTKLRAELLDPVDRDIAKILDHDLKDYFDHAKISELKGEKSTYKKVGALGPALLDVIKKVKSTAPADDDTKKKLKTLEETKDELLKKIEQMNSEYATKEKTIQTEYEKKLHDYKLDGELEKMSNGFIFAEGFEKIRPTITKSILADLKSKHSLTLGEKDGQAVIQVLEKDGKPKFNGNTPVTANQLLEDAFKDVIKKNNSGDSGKDKPEDTQRFKVDQPNNTFRQGTRTTVQ